MMLVFSAVAVVGGALLGRWVASRHQPRPPELSGAEAPAADGEGREASTPDVASQSSGDVLAAPAVAVEDVDWRLFPCALGDVVMRSFDGAEAWLAGAIVFREDAPTAALFIAPDATGDRAIYARPRPSAALLWLAGVKRESFAVGAEPPSALEIEGARFERRRRLPFRAQRVGTGTPEITGTAIVGEYAGAAGDVALVVVVDGVGRAWRGRALSEGEYEVWSGEKARAP